MPFYVVIGCPYTAMAALSKAIRDSGRPVRLVNTDDLAAIGDDAFELLGGGLLPIRECRASFVRYPYDLLPHFAGCFEDREKTEYLKSIALAVDGVAINPVASTWALRNRWFSLQAARTAGLRVPATRILSSDSINQRTWNNKVAVKAIGNCYVSQNSKDYADRWLFTKIVEAEDGSDRAAIFPASLMPEAEASTYLNAVGHALFQEPVCHANEFRGYFVDGDFFTFRRDGLDDFDKSAAGYLSWNLSLSLDSREAIARMAAVYKLRYLCFDYLVDEVGQETVIDINPFGSLPDFDLHPDPTRRLAKVLLDTVR